MFKLRRDTAPTSWEERTKELGSIMRYDGFKRMRYRSSVLFHTRRVRAMVRRVAPVVDSTLYLSRTHLEAELADVIAETHDDMEVITDDVSVIRKDHMTKEEREEHKRAEVMAAGMMSQALPERFRGYIYKRLLDHALRKDCLEAQLVKWLDWNDAICEILHEVLAGNLLFVRAIMRSAAGTKDLKDDYPALLPILERGGSPLLHAGFEKHLSPTVEEEPYLHLGKPHTPESIRLKTDFPFYDEWVDVVRGLGQEGIDYLTTRVDRVEGSMPLDLPQPLQCAIVV